MVDDLEDRLDLAVREAVVERRSEIQEDQGDAVDEAARRVPDAIAGIVDQHADECRYRECRAHAMRDRIEYLF